MKLLRPLIRSFVRDDRGAAAVEYALLAAVIGLGLTIAIFAFQEQLYDVYVNHITAAIRNYTD